MKTVATVAELREIRRQVPEPLGLVPTMGFLHEGHLSLVRQARRENRTVAVSIFVNPTQFGPSEDFSTYPRDTERDLALLEKEGADLVFMPEPAEMYPPQFNSWVEVCGITDQLEGKCRPGHFRGVTTVVAKLFNSVEPTTAYFGQKDAQQALVIQKMVSDLNMNLTVSVQPTLRESDGLAMSSRNTYLNPQERQAAVILYRSLMLAQKLYDGGERNAETIHRQIMALLTWEPLAEVQYVSIADTSTLEEVETINSSALVSMAVKIGKTRLIDNIILK